MSYKINGTVVIDNSRKVDACCVDAHCILPSVRFDAPCGFTVNRPASPAIGSIFFDRDLGALLTYDGTDWKTSGSEPNGIDGSVTYVSASNEPYQAVLERYDQIGMCCVPVAQYGGMQGTPHAALGVGSFTYTIIGGGTACGPDTYINNISGDEEVCCRAWVTRTSVISPHILNDGSMFAFFNYDQGNTGCVSSILRYYNHHLCSSVNTVSSFACLMASDGRNGHLTFPVSFGKVVASITNTDALFFGCGYASTGFTHPFVPWADGPKGKLTVGSSNSTYPGGLIGVTDSCNFGKTRFDFDFLVCENIPCYIFHKSQGLYPSLGNTNFFNCCTCFALVGIQDLVTAYTSVYSEACLCKYTKDCCLYVRVPMFSKDNLACKSSYCTLCSNYTYAPNPLTGQTVCRHERCTFANDYGIVYVGDFTQQTLCNAVSGVRMLMSLCTNKHFAIHCEHNGSSVCCRLGLNCAGSPICRRYLPMVEVFDIQNMCKVCCVSYRCWIDGPTSCCWWELMCHLTAGSGTMLTGVTCRHQDPNAPEKNYLFLNYSTSCTTDTVCGTAPCRADPGAILTFCETTLNFTAENPWAGLKCARNGVNDYLSLGCFRPTPSSCAFKWACLGCTSRLCQLCTINGNFSSCAASWGTNGLPNKFVVNPETNSIVAHFELEINCYISGIYLACYSLTNKCWTEGAVVWDSEKEYDRTGRVNSYLTFPAFCTCESKCQFVIGFTDYDTGAIFEFSANATCGLSANCSDLMSFCCYRGICHPCCAASVEGYVHHMTYKIPHDKKFCDIPGLIPDPCVPALLNYNVVQDICYGRAGYKESAELWSCIVVGKRLTSREVVALVKPTDCLMTERQGYCYCCTGTYTPIPVCDGNRVDSMKIYTMSQETGKYHSDFIEDRLGLSIKPSLNVRGTPGVIFGTSDHIPSEIKINTQTNCLYCITGPTSGITYCTE